MFQQLFKVQFDNQNIELKEPKIDVVTILIAMFEINVKVKSLKTTHREKKILIKN